MNYNDFVSKQKTKLIAPAGYGKTYTIAKCLEFTKGKQLILTHTHAGVASIKEKINSIVSVSASSYNIETISSFAQRYVINLYNRDEIPQQNDHNYHSWIIEKATELFDLNNVKDIIRASYSGLFIDEYQDCTIPQHKMIMKLSDILPIHIVGDPLQGIFNFNGELVDFEHDLNDFEEFPSLETPWRWNNAENETLGKCLKKIRVDLIESNYIDFSSYDVINFILVDNEEDKYTPKTIYNREIWKIVNDPTKNVLVLDPISSNIDRRINFIKNFKNSFRIIESIDSDEFYKLADMVDSLVTEFKFELLREILEKIFRKKDIDRWFNNNGVKRKKDPSENVILSKINDYIEKAKIEKNLINIKNILLEIKNTLNCVCYRKELFHSLLRAIDQALLQNISVYDAMVQNRNNIRREGRKIYGKCIGTTLLTKGLEFDTVAILDAHKFSDKKNLYVALTRGAKEVIVFSDTRNISFVA